MESTPRRRLADGLVAALLAAGALALYAATLAPTVLGGDGGEFQFVPYLLGVAHPTGYPLYCLLGWGWSHLLPLGDVAYRMNLFSALGAAAAVGLLYPTVLRLLGQAVPDLPPILKRLAAALAAASLAATPTLWSQAVIAEVYGLHILLVVLFFFFLLGWGEDRRPRSLLWAAVAFGLGLAHHRTTLLLAPAAMAYVWLAERRPLGNWRLASGRRIPPLAAGGLLLAACALPLLLYLYIPLRAPHTPYLVQPLAAGQSLVLYENTPAHFIDFVLGGPFGGSVDLSVDLGARLGMAWDLLSNEVTWAGLALALAGIATLALARRWALLALTGLAYGAIVAFNLVYTIGDIFVLFIPSYLAVVLWLAVGAAGLLHLARRLPLAARFVAAILLFLLPGWLAWHYYPEVDQSDNTRARDRWQAILAEPLPPGAVLATDDRNNIMALWYYQYVAGQRPDLLGIFPLITPQYSSLGSVLDLGLDTGRPLYLIKAMPGVEVKVGVEPERRLWRVVGPAAKREPVYPLGAELGGQLRLAGYDRQPHNPRPRMIMQVVLYWQALQPLEERYHTFVHLLGPDGQIVEQSDHQPGGVYYPSDLWQPGELLRDEHYLMLPADAPQGVYRLLAGAYALSGDGALQSLGEPVLLGQLAVKGELQTEPGPIVQPLEAAWDDEIELLGYDLAQEAGNLALTLHWRCLAPPAADYTVFVHLLDGDGQTLVQADGQPRGGAYPTSVWDAGEVVADEHHLPLPPDLPLGDYRLRLGLYRLETGVRLPLAGGGDTLEFDISLGEE